MGPRWQMSPLPLDPEPQYMLIVTHQQTKCNAHGHHDSSKVDHSINKLGAGSILEISGPSPNS